MPRRSNKENKKKRKSILNTINAAKAPLLGARDGGGGGMENQLD
jgi:hypothetical protein